MLPRSFALHTVTHSLLLLFGALILNVKASADNSAVPTTVNLRIEAATYTIFEGPVFTNGHNVTTASGGTHPCDGTNNNPNPTPGPTTTSVLNDASKLHHFSWDG